MARVGGQGQPEVEHGGPSEKEIPPPQVLRSVAARGSEFRRQAVAFGLYSAAVRHGFSAREEEELLRGFERVLSAPVLDLEDLRDRHGGGAVDIALSRLLIDAGRRPESGARPRVQVREYLLEVAGTEVSERLGGYLETHGRVAAGPTGAENGATPPSAEIRAWVISTAWSSLHRDRAEGAARLIATLRGTIEEQAAAFESLMAADELPGVAQATSALRGLALDDYLRSATLGGALFHELTRAAERGVRQDAMSALSVCLTDRGAALEDAIEQAKDQPCIEQLVALWLAWTDPAIDAFGLAVVALTRAVVLGGVSGDELLFVATRYEGIS